MRKFNLNDWVIRINNGHKGSVVAVEGDYYRVKWMFYTSGNKLIESLAIESLHLGNELTEWPIGPKEFSYDVLDIALLTKDEEWYNEIMSLKGENVE